MALDIHQREHEGISILDLKGRITVGPEATVYLDRNGEVERITMRGRVDGDPFRLDWSAR